MHILQVHNQYRPAWGGEDTVADLEADLLRRNNHKVDRLSLWTGELEGANFGRLISAGFGTVWSIRGYRLMREAIARFSPDVTHVHNTFPLLSPSIYWAANRARVPVVQTLHNYRFTCANALLLRAERPCEDCVGRFGWSGLRHRCHSSALGRTAAVTAMNSVHRWLGTFHNKVQGYIALSEFSKQIMVRAGLPDERIHIKPNFTLDPGKSIQLRFPRLVFAGSITRFKGIHLLLEAWARLAPSGYQLHILGDGPDRGAFERQFASNATIIWHGNKSREAVIDLVATSKWLVLPSLAYENFPMSVVEAFSVGTPAIAPRQGVFTGMISDAKDGLLFSLVEPESLRENLEKALALDESSWLQMSISSRDKYLRKYTDQENYTLLMHIYEQAIDSFRSRLSAA